MTNDFPAAAILAVAKKQKRDLISMVSHGHRGIASAPPGSETQKVLTHSKLPVLASRQMWQRAPATTAGPPARVPR